MSKLIDSLNKVQATMTEKQNPKPSVEIPPLYPPRDEELRPVKKSESPFNKQILYSIGVAVLVIVVMALTLSYKAFVLIQERNSQVSKLVSVVTKQNEKIKSLEDSITQLSSLQSQQLSDLKNGMAAIEQRINKSAKEVAQIAVDTDILNTQIQDLKTENKTIKNKNSFLAVEIDKLKQTLARMMGETSELQQP